MNSTEWSRNKKAPYRRGFENKLLSTVDCQPLTDLQIFEFVHDFLGDPSKGIATIVEKFLHGYHAG